MLMFGLAFIGFMTTFCQYAVAERDTSTFWAIAAKGNKTNSNNTVGTAVLFMLFLFYLVCLWSIVFFFIILIIHGI